ncbi:MAG: hypothetical protein PVH61_05515 [Candidatus Aminicenantes bacterium]|jgi:hypothetical protein
MRIKIGTKGLILLLMLMTGLSTNLPLVLCFQEDGHVRLEFEGLSLIEPAAKPVTCNWDSPFHCNDGKTWQSGCGNCYDLPVFTENLINEKNENSDHFLLTIRSDASMWTFFQSSPEILSSGIKSSYQWQQSSSLIAKKVVLLI